VNMSYYLGDLPIRYYQMGEWAPADDLSGVTLREKYLIRNRACHKCLIACGLETKAPAYGDERLENGS
jgi:aldehyde:ferredoxin oxidoreductase